MRRRGGMSDDKARRPVRTVCPMKARLEGYRSSLMPLSEKSIGIPMPDESVVEAPFPQISDRFYLCCGPRIYALFPAFPSNWTRFIALPPSRH